MEQETKMEGCCGQKKCGKMGGGCTSGAVYCLGAIGAAVYYIQNAATFWAGVVGVLKAIVWPAFVVYYALPYLGA